MKKKYNKWFKSHFGFYPYDKCFRMINPVDELINTRENDKFLSDKDKLRLRVITFEEFNKDCNLKIKK